MENQANGGLPDDVARVITSAGDLTIKAGTTMMARAALGPIGPVVAAPVNKAISLAPPEAKLAGGLGAGIGAASALKGIALAGTVAVAPAVVAVTCVAAAVGLIALGGTWLFKGWSR